MLDIVSVIALPAANENVVNTIENTFIDHYLCAT